MSDQAQPISIETLLQKQKEEKEAASRVSPKSSSLGVILDHPTPPRSQNSSQRLNVPNSRLPNVTMKSRNGEKRKSANVKIERS